MKLQYAVIYERTPNNYAAYAPDVPGCGSTGKTLDDIRANIAEGLAFHIEGLLELGEPVPEPRMSLDEAMAYHKQVLAEYDKDIPESTATAGMVEIGIEDAMDTNRQNLVEGTLVTWTGSGALDKYGVLTKVNEVVEVRWDDNNFDYPSRFSVIDTPLERVNLAGRRVERRSTGEIAVAMRPLSVGGIPMWECLLSGNLTMVNLQERDLRPIPITDPSERFQNNMIGSIRAYRLQEVARWYLWQHNHNALVSLGNVRVDIMPHQVGVVHKIVNNYPHRFLLCDEVGLGKTIEAGLALKELRTRGETRRVLIIVPSNLSRQWQFEMKTKFNETFAILNTDTVNYIRNEGFVGNPFTYSENVICSSTWVSRKDWATLCKDVAWDLIIVDEAHHARMHEDGRTTQLYDIVHELALANDAARRRSLLLLTATPMQLGTHEIYALVELLDPVLFPSPGDFERHRKSVPGLNRLVERLKSEKSSISDHDSQQMAEWLEIETDTILQRLSRGQGERENLASDLSDRHLLSEVMIRNRKSVVGGFMPRTATRWEVELSQEEREATEALEAYIQYGFNLAEGSGGNVIGFVMVTFQKLMASSIAAIRSSLTARRDRLQQRHSSQHSQSGLKERLDDDDRASDVLGSVNGRYVSAEVDFLNTTIQMLNRVKTDSKSMVLLAQLTELREEDDNQKVLIFTQFRETQNYLADLLENNGWEVNLFHGQMSPAAKDSAVEQFRDKSGPQVLISTEAGGEGRNLQFCHLLVNYDLPWNPMRVEQRIGRVDRIGQKHVVNIFNLWVRDTIEERVLDVLENRINVFQETIGGLDPILGETENDIQKIMRMSADTRDVALKELGTRLEVDVRQAREAEKQLGDFIMDTKSFSREIAERIAGQPSPINNSDVDRFMGQLLSDVRTYIKKRGDGYELTFKDRFVVENIDLFPAGKKVNAVFRPDRLSDSQNVELMAFGHPIVDTIIETVLGEGYEGVTGTRRILAGDDINPVSGWLFTYSFTVPGIRPVEHLVPVFVSDSGNVNLDVGRALVERACLFDRNEGEINYGSIPNNLAETKTIVDEFIHEKHSSLQSEASRHASTQVDQEITRLAKYFDYRERVAQDKLSDTRNTLTRLSETLEGVQQRQVLRIWESRVREAEAVVNALPEERERQISNAERFRDPAVAYSLKSLGRIEVI